jgi:diacylglycerol kinase family enzyme
MRAAEVRISAERPFAVYADGDPIAALPALVRALPGAIRVFVPAAEAHRESGDRIAAATESER